MSPCEIVTRCLSGSTSTTLPFNSYLFSLPGRHDATKTHKPATKKHKKTDCIFCGLIWVEVVRRRDVDRSRNSTSLYTRNPSFAKNRSPQRTDRRHWNANARSSERDCQRRHCKRLRLPVADSETAETDWQGIASQR